MSGGTLNPICTHSIIFKKKANFSGILEHEVAVQKVAEDV